MEPDKERELVERLQGDLAYAKQALDRETARALKFGTALIAAEAQLDRMRLALEAIADQPERFDDGTHSYDVGYAFHLVTSRARSALKGETP